jgi:hypothetical protein
MVRAAPVAKITGVDQFIHWLGSTQASIKEAKTSPLILKNARKGDPQAG